MKLDLPPERIAQLDRIEMMLSSLSMTPTSLLTAKDKGSGLADIIKKHGHGSKEYKSFVAEMNNQ